MKNRKSHRHVAVRWKRMHCKA